METDGVKRGSRDQCTPGEGEAARQEPIGRAAGVRERRRRVVNVVDHAAAEEDAAGLPALVAAGAPPPEEDARSFVSGENAGQAFFMLTDSGPVMARLVGVSSAWGESSAQEQQQRQQRQRQQAQRAQQRRRGGIGGRAILSAGGSYSAHAQQQQSEPWPTDVDVDNHPDVVAPPDSAASGKPTDSTPPAVHPSGSHDTTHGELVAFETTRLSGQASGDGLAVEVTEDFSRADLELEDSTPQSDLTTAEEKRKRRSRRRGTEPDTSNSQDVDAEKRRKDRNRRAQRAFRERQKKRISDANTQLSELREKIHRLEVENAEIKKENEMLRCYVEQFGILPPRSHAA